MKKKIGFVVAMALVGLALLSIRYYMVDLPVWHFFGGGNGPNPATLHLRGEFVESNLGAAEGPAGSVTVRMIWHLIERAPGQSIGDVENHVLQSPILTDHDGFQMGGRTPAGLGTEGVFRHVDAPHMRGRAGEFHRSGNLAFSSSVNSWGQHQLRTTK